MKRILFSIALFLLTLHSTASAAQEESSTLWKGRGWEGRISRDGCLEQIVFFHDKGRDNDTVPFFKAAEQFRGPSFYAVLGSGETVDAAWIPDGHLSYRTGIDGVECSLTYTSWKGEPALRITLTNRGHVPFQPVKAGLRLGIDTYMDTYPEWFGKYFPTLMRNEKTHFTGYLQTPSGYTLGLVCPQPVASWSVEYNLGYQDPAPHWFMGHRIESLNIDLLNALPLPSRNPQDLWCLRQGESRSWTLVLIDIEAPGQFETKLSSIADIPMIRMERTGYGAGETAVFDVLGDSPQVIVTDDSGRQMDLAVGKVPGAEDAVRISCPLTETGLYTVKVTDGDRQAEGILTVHAPWQWILERAREGAWKYSQKATSHIESWYGFHSAFIAARYFPDKELDTKLTDRFEYLFNLLHDTVSMQPRYYSFRIQNTSGTIGMLVDRYQAHGDIRDLRRASRLADWLISEQQREDGAYVNRSTVYTSVIYIAKSMMELALAEREAAGQDTGAGSEDGDIRWAAAAERHYLSAKRAVDQLVASQGDFETEGEMTFEDGMISCSALQIGMLALLQEDTAARKHYTGAMLDILRSHDCLAQLRVPDARRRGGTMRYWEAQYDVQMLPNMFNSPHGWSGWRAYATYYAYLLTGEERWLTETFNAACAFSNLIDYRTGDLRWAFVVDPYLRVTQACSADSHVTADSLSFGNPHPELYDTRSFVIGEQYVNMISDWQTVNTQDNDVHEVFKFIGEALLTNAFIIERPDGSVSGYNCTVSRHGDTLRVTPAEKQITSLHCNLSNAWTVSFPGHSSTDLPADFLGWLD